MGNLSQLFQFVRFFGRRRTIEMEKNFSRKGCQKRDNAGFSHECADLKGVFLSQVRILPI